MHKGEDYQTNKLFCIITSSLSYQYIIAAVENNKPSQLLGKGFWGYWIRALSILRKPWLYIHRGTAMVEDPFATLLLGGKIIHVMLPED